MASGDSTDFSDAHTNTFANANKFGQIHRINDILGLATPILTTPLELLGGADNDT